jgi:hypothetical protein
MLFSAAGIARSAVHRGRQYLARVFQLREAFSERSYCLTECTLTLIGLSLPPFEHLPDHAWCIAASINIC